MLISVAFVASKVHVIYRKQYCVVLGHHSLNSLTARLVSRSRLNPVDPTLPPVHNMRMVCLKKEFSDAEEALHEARVVLEALEERNGTAAVLYSAMVKLEMK